MTARLIQWLGYKWMLWGQGSVMKAYQLTFSTPEGRIVLQHLIDGIYCQVCHSKDPLDLASHNGARAVIHGILEKIDMAEHPDKYALAGVEGVDEQPTR